MIQEYSGQQIGSYQLIHVLGQGGFATVYLGEHLYLKTSVAVKLLQARMASQDLQNFLKEAQTIAKLDHPHIIRVTDFGIDDTTSQPFFVMEYASQGSLRKTHPRGSILPLRTVVLYAQQVASALHYAHTQKIVHCDVKPENMLVASTNKIVLSDFGIAVTAHTTESISKQNITGTALYMAPEQIRGKARPASDQYALGVVVYEWLCGVCPFEKPTSIATMVSHLTDEPPPLRERVPSISQEVEDIVMKALAKDPQQRFTDINEFVLSLDDAYQKSTQPRIKRTRFISYTTHSLPPTPLDANAPTEPSQATRLVPLATTIADSVELTETTGPRANSAFTSSSPQAHVRHHIIEPFTKWTKLKIGSALGAGFLAILLLWTIFPRIALLNQAQQSQHPINAQTNATASGVPSFSALTYTDPLNDAERPMTRTAKWQKNTQCTFESDGYHTRGNTGLYLCFESGYSFKDAKIVMDVILQQGHSGGLVVHTQKASSIYCPECLGYFFEINQTGRYKITALSAAVVQDWTFSSSLKQGYGAVNTLSVVIWQNTYHFFINGTLASSFSDTTYSSGWISCMISPGTLTTELICRNLRVYQTQK